MPGADLTDPAPATTFAHLDAITVLSRGMASKGYHPAVDPAFTWHEVEVEMQIRATDGS